MHVAASTGYQAILAAPGFSLGVRCSDESIQAIDFLPVRDELAPQNALAALAARQILAYLADAEYIFTLPLRPVGTPFQRRVWQQIAAIPAHQTRTYGAIADALQNSPRAVGQACGANPYPVVVPCHRVIACGGELGGFARQNGGFLLTVKRWLLAHEGH